LTFSACAMLSSSAVASGRGASTTDGAGCPPCTDPALASSSAHPPASFRVASPTHPTSSLASCRADGGAPHATTTPVDSADHVGSPHPAAGMAAAAALLASTSLAKLGGAGPLPRVRTTRSGQRGASLRGTSMFVGTATYPDARFERNMDGISVERAPRPGPRVPRCPASNEVGCDDASSFSG